MFKKDVGVKNFSNLKNSERKNLLSDPNYTIPSVVKKSVFKNQLTKGTIYTDGNLKPIWFKLNDNPDLIPTVFTLWDNPNLIPVVTTHEIVIYDHIIGGADLMLPGTIPPFDSSLVKGKLVAIVSKENNLCAMAVGYLMMDLYGKDRVYGTTGVAVKVLHYYNDELYKLYDAEKLEIPTNDQLIDLVKKEEVGEVQEGNEDVQEEVQEEPEIKKEEQAIKIEDVAESLSELSVEDVDHFFHRSLLYSLTQDKIETPITSSNFMSNHIIKNLQIDSNIKKTSYKKTAKWLKHLERSGYLKLKGKGDDLTIVDVMKKENNDELKNFVPYKVKKQTTVDTPQVSSGKAQLQIINLYKPQQRTRVFFDEMDTDFYNYYSQQDLKNLLNSYIKRENLVSPKNSKQIVLDQTLSSMIKSPDSTIGRDKIFLEFLNKNFSKFYQIVYLNGKNSELYKGELPKFKIILETPMGNKQITKIQYPNFDILNINLKNFNNELKTKCSSSTTITDTLIHPDGTKNNKGYYEIMIQGAHERLVIDLLTKEYGVSVSWIEVENKLKNRRKKRS